MLLLDAVAYELAPILRQNQDLTLRQKLARLLVSTKWNGIDYQASHTSQSHYRVSHVPGENVSTGVRDSRKDADTQRYRGDGRYSEKEWL